MRCTSVLDPSGGATRLYDLCQIGGLARWLWCLVRLACPLGAARWQYGSLSIG